MRKICTICLIALASCSEKNDATQQTTTATTTVETTPAKTDTVATVSALQIKPIEAQGDLGRVTFSQNDKTIFYYDSKQKKGEVMVNDQMQTLTNYAFDSKKEIYEISNAEVKIVTGPCKFKENDGSDCFYGTIKDITISSGNMQTVIHDVDVQDCPNY